MAYEAKIVPSSEVFPCWKYSLPMEKPAADSAIRGGLRQVTLDRNENLFGFNLTPHRKGPLHAPPTLQPSTPVRRVR